jgi:hypothetical protein
VSDHVRFTAYLSSEEDTALRKMSKDEGTSMNYLVRCGVRMLLGLKIPNSIQRTVEEALHAEDS